MARPRNDNFVKEKFYFHRYDPGVGPVSDWKIMFEAHITNISDSSSPNWSENFDMGRADPTVFYSSMNRTLTVDFKVVAVNSEEQYDNHENKLAKLGKLTYPLYKSGNGYNAPHIYFQIGDLYKGYGILTSVNYSWNNESVWIEGRPIVTDASLSIRILGDSIGNRPSVKARYFI